VKSDKEINKTKKDIPSTVATMSDWLATGFANRYATKISKMIARAVIIKFNLFHGFVEPSAERHDLEGGGFGYESKALDVMFIHSEGNS